MSSNDAVIKVGTRVAGLVVAGVAGVDQRPYRVVEGIHRPIRHAHDAQNLG